MKRQLGEFFMTPAKDGGIQGQAPKKEEIEKAFYPGEGLPGGGQLEIRMEVSSEHPDPDVLEVARRFKSYNLESWHSEWMRVAEKNEELAAGFEREQRKVTAHEFYRRGAHFFRQGPVFMAGSDPRMLPNFVQLQQKVVRDWRLVFPPLERGQIPY